MTTRELSECVDKITDCNGRLNMQKFRKNKEFYDYVYNYTQFLDVDAREIERIYCTLNNISTVPRCNIHNTKLRFRDYKTGYSISRAQASKNNRDSKVIGQQTLKNNRDKLWKDFLSIEQYREYSTRQILDYVDQNNIRQISINSIMRNPDIFCNLWKLTNFLDKDVRFSERVYCLRNNITSKPSKDSKFISISRGYTSGSRADRYNNIRSEIEDVINLQGFSVLDPIYNVNEQVKINIKCNVCDTVKSQFITCAHYKNICCNKCNNKFHRSHAEDEIVDFLKVDCDIENIETNKLIDNHRSVDIMLPDYNIAIEYHGLIWHSFGSSYPNNIQHEKAHKTRDLDKWQYLKDKDIQLIIIYESEWRDKRSIVKSIIRSKLKLNNIRVYARQCKIKSINSHIKRDFLEDNHIQGNCNSSYNYGLFYNGEIVSMITLGNRKMGRGNSKFELLRYCNRQNTYIIGGFKKLLNYTFLQHIEEDEILSFCDKRYSIGSGYDASGFEYIGDTQIGYSYVNRGNIENRIRYQKHKLNDVLDYFDPLKTEKMNMICNGFRILYDCGHLKYTIKRPLLA